MCVVSMVIDNGIEKLPDYYPNIKIWPDDSYRIAELERKVAELEDLMRKAKQYDEEHDQPDCEMVDKQAILQKIAEDLGVEIEFP